MMQDAHQNTPDDDHPILEVCTARGPLVVIDSDGRVFYRGIQLWEWVVFHLSANALVTWAVCELAR